MPEVTILKGNAFSDQRGTISFVNDFTFAGVRRFYHIAHADTRIVRAWQGHRVEQKYFFVPHGSFLLAWVRIDNWDEPSRDLNAAHIILTDDEPRVVIIPPGYANGLKALAPGSVLSVYSNLELADSEKDRWSFDQGLWLDWSQF